MQHLNPLAAPHERVPLTVTQALIGDAAPIEIDRVGLVLEVKM